MPAAMCAPQPVHDIHRLMRTDAVRTQNLGQSQSFVIFTKIFESTGIVNNILESLWRPCSSTAAIEDNILYEPALFGKPEQQLFEPQYWLSRNAATSISGGRGQVVFIRDSQRNWVLRHYRRGGLIAKFNADRYLWQGVEADTMFSRMAIAR